MPQVQIKIIGLTLLFKSNSLIMKTLLLSMKNKNKTRIMQLDRSPKYKINQLHHRMHKIKAIKITNKLQ